MSIIRSSLHRYDDLNLGGRAYFGGHNASAYLSIGKNLLIHHFPSIYLKQASKLRVSECPNVDTRASNMAKILLFWFLDFFLKKWRNLEGRQVLLYNSVLFPPPVFGNQQPLWLKKGRVLTHFQMRKVVFKIFFTFSEFCYFCPFCIVAAGWCKW